MEMQIRLTRMCSRQRIAPAASAVLSKPYSVAKAAPMGAKTMSKIAEKMGASPITVPRPTPIHFEPSSWKGSVPVNALIIPTKKNKIIAAVGDFTRVIPGNANRYITAETAQMIFGFTLSNNLPAKKREQILPIDKDVQIKAIDEYSTPRLEARGTQKRPTRFVHKKANPMFRTHPTQHKRPLVFAVISFPPYLFMASFCKENISPCRMIF